MYVYTSCIHYIYTGEVLLSLSLSLRVTCDLRHLGQYEVHILNPGGYNLSFHGISITSKPGGFVPPKDLGPIIPSNLRPESNSTKVTPGTISFPTLKS